MYKRKPNTIVRVGIILDTLGLFIALFVNLPFGISVMVAGLVVSVVGLVQCIKHKGNVGVAGFYVILGLVFLMYAFFFA